MMVSSAPSPKEFQALFDLLRLVQDPKAAAKRLDELRLAAESANTAIEALNAERRQIDDAWAAVNAAFLAARNQALTEAEEKLIAERALLAAREAALEARLARLREIAG